MPAGEGLGHAWVVLFKSLPRLGPHERVGVAEEPVAEHAVVVVDAVEKLKDLGVSFYDIDVAELQAAYQAKAAEKGFTFDPDWQAAVDEAVASVS